MKTLSGFLVCALVLLVVVPALVFAGDVSGPAYGVPDPEISAPSPVPAAAAAQKTLVQNAYLVLTTSTPQPGGILYLGSSPDGASVYIDGSFKGTTPLTIRPIAPGVHAVTLKKAGYADYSTKVTITAGVSKMAANLVPVTPERLPVPCLPYRQRPGSRSPAYLSRSSQQPRSPQQPRFLQQPFLLRSCGQQRRPRNNPAPVRGTISAPGQW